MGKGEERGHHMTTAREKPTKVELGQGKSGPKGLHTTRRASACGGGNPLKILPHRSYRETPLPTGQPRKAEVCRDGEEHRYCLG